MINNNLNIKHHNTIPMRAIPVEELLFDKFVSLEEETVFRSLTEFQQSTDDVSVSSSYNVLKDLKLESLIRKFDYCVDYYTSNVLQTPINFKMVGSWLTKNTLGTKHWPHTHSNSIISVVTYFGDFNNNEMSGIQFNNFGLAKIFENFKIDYYNPNKPTEWNIFNNLSFTIKAKPNQVIVFPSHIEHESQLCDTSERYCLGANYFVSGTFGSDKEKNILTFN